MRTTWSFDTLHAICIFSPWLSTSLFSSYWYAPWLCFDFFGTFVSCTSVEYPAPFIGQCVRGYMAIRFLQTIAVGMGRIRTTMKIIGGIDAALWAYGPFSSPFSRYAAIIYMFSTTQTTFRRIFSQSLQASPLMMITHPMDVACTRTGQQSLLCLVWVDLYHFLFLVA